ncbi:hypothetical protein Tco_0256124 [Tanacetum coccineum]
MKIRRKFENDTRGFPERIKGNITSSSLHLCMMPHQHGSEQVEQKQFQVGLPEFGGRKLQAYAAAPTENRGYAGNLPKCNHCNFHHSGRCPPKCQKLPMNWSSGTPALMEEAHAEKLAWGWKIRKRIECGLRASFERVQASGEKNLDHLRVSRTDKMKLMTFEVVRDFLRDLNKLTIKNTLSLPRIEDWFDNFKVRVVSSR